MPCRYIQIRTIENNGNPDSPDRRTALNSTPLWPSLETCNLLSPFAHHANQEELLLGVSEKIRTDSLEGSCLLQGSHMLQMGCSCCKGPGKADK